MKSLPRYFVRYKCMVPAPLAGLLADLRPEGWTRPERDKFMSVFTTMLDYCVPIVEPTDDKKLPAPPTV